MTIVETCADDDWGREAIRLEINGNIIYQLVDGEPEDNCLARNFNFDVEEMLSRVYYAGEAGSGFEFVRKRVTWEEFWDAD